MAVILTFDPGQSSHPLNPGSLPKSWSILGSLESWFKCQRVYAINPYQHGGNTDF